MNKNTVYILQKDLPEAKAGTELRFDGDIDYDYVATNGEECWYKKHYVENNPEWFKPKEEVNESKQTQEPENIQELFDKIKSELVKEQEFEFAVSVRKIEREYKQSKYKKEEPQWEILEIECYGGEIRKLIDGEYRLYTDGVGFTATYLLQRSDSKIKTVKRLSDGEVFSVGDVIKVHTDIKPIVSFELKNNKQIWCSIDNAKGYGSCLSVSEKAPKEEQVPIKVEIMEFGYGKPQENKGKFYVANFNLPNNAKLPTEKYQSIKSAIEDVLNEDKIKHEKLLSKIESKVRLANMINTQANYLKETLDYINSLK